VIARVSVSHWIEASLLLNCLSRSSPAGGRGSRAKASCFRSDDQTKHELQLLGSAGTSNRRINDTLIQLPRHSETSTSRFSHHTTKMSTVAAPRSSRESKPRESKPKESKPKEPKPKESKSKEAKEDKSKVHKLSLKGSSKLCVEFFEFATNTILFQRGVYPPEDFSPYVQSSNSSRIAANFILVSRSMA
jgi:hypothetical protein